MVFNGTAVTRGRGRAVVTATGMAHGDGPIARLLGQHRGGAHAAAARDRPLGRMLGIAVIVIAVVVVGGDPADLRHRARRATSSTSCWSACRWPWPPCPRACRRSCRSSSPWASSAWPATHAIVKKLSSVETLGSASVDLLGQDRHPDPERDDHPADRDRARARSTSPASAIDPRASCTSTAGRSTTATLLDEVRFVLGGGSLANDAVAARGRTASGRPGRPDRGGVPGRRAQARHHRGRGEDRFERVGEVPFTSERKLMSTLQADADRDGSVAVVTKGAPDVLLARCTHERVGRRGAAARPTSAGPSDPRHRRPPRRRGAAHARRRLPAAARRRPTGPSDEALERELVYLGHGRHHRPAAAGGAHARSPRRTAAGVRVMMITGDHPRTAARIAADLGIVDAPAHAALDRRRDRRPRRRRARARRCATIVGLRPGRARAQAAHRRRPPGRRATSWP